MSDDDANTVLEPYTEKTILRPFKIQVKDGHSFYVNHYLLGEQSPVFMKIFFGEFKEARDLEAHLPDESVETLNLIFSTIGMGYPVPKEISDDGLFELIRMVHLYDMAALRKRCVDYIGKRMCPKETRNSEELIWMSTLLQFLIDDGHEDYKEVKLDIADSIASVTIPQLIIIRIWEKVKEVRFLQTIIETSCKNTSLLENEKHTLGYAYTSDNYTFCCRCPIPSETQAILTCKKCSQRFCPMHHVDTHCPKKPDLLKIDRTRLC